MKTYQEIYQNSMSNELQKISGIGSELVASAVTAPASDIYQEAFKDELQKIAGKYSPEQMSDFRTATKDWQKKTRRTAKAAPFYQKATPLAGAVAGGAAGLAATKALKGKGGALAGMALSGGGFLAGAYGGLKAISKTKYMKGMKKHQDEYVAKAKTIEDRK